jgi:tetratricopeptide (TPR) repeat protein
MNAFFEHLARSLGALALRRRAAARFDVADDARRAALLLRACACVRVGEWDHAEQLLESGVFAETDPAAVNLLGVLCEKRGLLAQARRHYGRAIRAERSFQPARQNLCRWFELDTFGHTSLPLLVGDEEPRLWLLRRNAAGGANGARRERLGISAIETGPFNHAN